jgi:prepilin-type processing-associated H-X9-DG protein
MAQHARLLDWIEHENEDSIDDAHFLTWPAPDDRWVNMPADRHGQAGVLSFADGHAESWRWRWPKQLKHKQSYWKRVEGPADLADLRRLQEAILPVDGFVPQP